MVHVDKSQSCLCREYHNSKVMFFVYLDNGRVICSYA